MSLLTLTATEPVGSVRREAGQASTYTGTGTVNDG